MTAARSLIAFCSLLLLTEAFIEFEHSRLFDEGDFNGVGAVNVPLYCNLGCRIYVSIPENSAEFAKQIMIQDYDVTKDESSLYDANTHGADGQKTPYLVKTGNSQVDFINQDANLRTAPIFVWIVRGDAPNIDTAEVYDAEQTFRGQRPAGIITVLNAVPYVLKTLTDGAMSVRAVAAGFDAITECSAEILHADEATYADVHVPVAAPLITLHFDAAGAHPESAVQLVATDENVGSFELDRPAFVTSPGYVGCSKATAGPGEQPTRNFRSSLYEEVNDVRFSSDEALLVDLSGDLDVDQAHPVDINDDGKHTSWSGQSTDGTNLRTAQVSTKDLTISWTRNLQELEQRFLVRVEPALGPLPEKTTTAEPEPEPVKTTTAEPEPEPVKTTTTEPEPEPVKTTTTEPEPEPVKTTTADPEEPVKTTTAEPEPEPVKTTTEAPEPEPVKTTTVEPEPEPVKTTTEASEPEPVRTTTTEPEPEPVKTTTAEPEEPVKTTTAEPDPVTEETSPAPPPTQRPGTSRRTTRPPTTTFHPKATTSRAAENWSTATTAAPAPPPTTSGSRGTSIVLAILLAVGAALL